MKKRKYLQLFIRNILIVSFDVLIMIALIYFLYVFNFIEISPKAYLIHSWTTAKWTDQWQGDVLSIGFALVLSIINALVYFVLFKKVLSLWLSALYGVVLWLFMGYILSFMTTNIPILHTLS